MFTAKTDLMRHSFKTEFDKLFEFYHFKSRIECKKEQKFKSIFNKFNEFKKVYYRSEIKFLKDDLSEDSSSSDCSSSSSNKSEKSQSSNMSSVKQSKGFLKK